MAATTKSITLPTAGTSGVIPVRDPRIREENLQLDQGVDDYRLEVVATVANSTGAGVVCSVADQRKILAKLILTMAVRNLNPHILAIPLNWVQVFAEKLVDAWTLTATTIPTVASADVTIVCRIPLMRFATKIRRSRDWRTPAGVLGVLETKVTRDANPTLTTGLTLGSVTVTHRPVPKPCRNHFIGPLWSLSVQTGTDDAITGPAGLALAAYATTAGTVTNLALRSGERTLFDQLSAADVGSYYPELVASSFDANSQLATGFAVLLAPNDCDEGDLQVAPLVLAQAGASAVQDLGLVLSAVPFWDDNTWKQAAEALGSFYVLGPADYPSLPKGALRIIDSKLKDGAYRAKVLSPYAPRVYTFGDPMAAAVPNLMVPGGPGGIGKATLQVPAVFMGRVNGAEPEKAIASLLPGGYTPDLSPAPVAEQLTAKAIDLSNAGGAYRQAA